MLSIFPTKFRSRSIVFISAAGFLAAPAPAVMYNRDTGDQPSRALALLPPFASRAIMSGGGCTAVIIAPDAALCAAHCKDYAASGAINITWNGQTRAGSFLKIGADHMVVKLDTPFTGTAGKMTAPYAGNTENGRLAWKVAQGGHGILGPGATGPFYDNIFRGMTTRIEVNNVASPPNPVSGDWLFYDYDGPPTQPTGGRVTTRYEGGTAPGDSGGPLYMFENGRWWVIGVTSGPDAGFYRDGRVRTDMAEIEAFTGYSWARPVEPALEMKWVAQDLSGSLANGAAVTSWARQGGAESWTTSAADGGVGTPLLVSNATPTGRAAVNFGGNSRLGLPAAGNPVANETAFTVAMVFKANGAGAGAQGNWFDNTGLLDADEPGVVNDWGVALANTGRPALGVGNPDASLYAGGASLVDGNWHVLVASWDASEVTGDAAGTDRNMTLYVDSPGNAVRRAGPEFLNMARRAAGLTLGGSRNAARYFNGQVAEVRLYRGALDETAAGSVLTELRNSYISAAPGVILTSPLVRRVALPPGQGLVLEGTVSGTAPVLSITQTSGPGAAVFSPATSLPSYVTFPVAGTYQIQLAVTSGASTVTESLTVESLATPASLPSAAALTLSGPWSGVDIGGVTAAGSGTVTGSSAALIGAGKGFEEVSDSLRFVSQPMTGNGSMTVRVAGFSAAANAEARAGLMVRAEGGRESAMVAVTLSKSGVVRFTRREEAAAYTDVTDFAASVPYWLRLTRSGTGFSCFHSANGTTWAQLGAAASLPGIPVRVLAGVTMFSTDNAATTTANLDNLTLQQTGPPPVAPLVTLAAGQNPALGNAFSLTAVSTASPAPVFAWEKGNGPGELFFATPAALVSKTAFSAPGNYLVRMTAEDGVMKSFVERTFDFALDARWNFNTPGNVEGWSGANLGTLIAADGLLSGSVSATDPQISRNAAVYVSGDLAKHLLVRYRSSAAGSAQWFWGRSGAGGFTGVRSVSTAYTPANAWRTLLFDVTNHVEWKTRVTTDLRFDPTGGANSTFDIDWMALSDGDFDGDGLTDLVETTTDTDNDGLVNLEDPDSDNDGLPDAFEAQYGLNRLLSGDAVLDLDRDGQNNLTEYTAGTHPGNASDGFRVLSAVRAGTGQFSVTIPARTGRRYVMERRTDLSAGAWATVLTSPVQTADSTLPLTDSSAAAGRRFYRVRVEWP